jgi:acyl dehydratase
MTTDRFSLNSADTFIGKELGTSKWTVISQARIQQFAECTNDHQWIHVDVERAKRETPFGGTIAHGYLTLAMLADTMFEVVVNPAGITQVLNYGLDRVRFLTPVKAGSRIRNRIKLLAAEPKESGRLLLTTENTIEIDGEAKPALIAIALFMVVGP